MTDAAVEYRRTLIDYRYRMAADPAVDGITYDAYVWWMAQQLREMQEARVAVPSPPIARLWAAAKRFVRALTA